MYTQFYGFREKPFNINPDPKFLYLTPGHRETLAAMIYGVKERKGFISVTGEVGTGKTVLIYALLRNLEKNIKIIHVSHTDIEFVDLLKMILLELGLPVHETSKHLLLHRLRRHLLHNSDFKNLTLVIDEAQNLSAELMEEIRMLSNIETATTKLLQVLLVGQPELELKLNAENMRQFKQRIGIRRYIAPLSERQCVDYIDHRLRLVGSNQREVFARAALPLIYEYTKGIPRSINILCDNALLIGFSNSQTKIDEHIVREVIADLEGKWKPPEDLPNNADKETASRDGTGRRLQILNKLLVHIRSKRISAE